MVKAAIATERGGKFDYGRINREAAAARDERIALALRELSHLSFEKAAAELARLGYGWFSYATVRRARQRLGLSAPKKAAGIAEPRRRQAARKTNQEIASA
jgi:hypothetical protein